MKNHFYLSDEELVQQFSSCELDPDIFSHEAHLRLAWILIDKYGVERAVDLIQDGLRQFVESIGADDKYHATLTVAAVKAVHHFMLKSMSGDFSEFMAEFPELKTKFKQLIAAHYGFDIYRSEAARINYIEPDLIAFD